MFIKFLLGLCFLTLTQNITAQKLDSTRSKTNDLLTASTEVTATLMAKSVKATDSLTSKSTDTLGIKTGDSLTVKGADSSFIRAKDTLSAVKSTVSVAQQMDSIWLKSGDTLVGFINLDKDKNAFLFSNDTVQSLQLKPEEVVRLTAFPKKYEEERFDVFSVFGAFYFLETSPNALIRIFANRKFKSIVNDGPKHFVVENKYCLFKNDVPYFLNGSRNKEILLFLMNDCKGVMDGFKSGKYTKDNFIEAVTQYNRCN